MSSSGNGNRYQSDPMELDWENGDAGVPAAATSRGWIVAGCGAAAALLLLIGFIVGQTLGAEAMATCQQAHSFDTCFLALEG